LDNWALSLLSGPMRSTSAPVEAPRRAQESDRVQHSSEPQGKGAEVAANAAPAKRRCRRAVDAASSSWIPTKSPE
jgi:hypothetical protein